MYCLKYVLPKNSTIFSMYDDICRFLAESFPSDFAHWLTGEPVAMTELQPSELLLEPIRADAMIMLQSEAAILHVEFQTQPHRKIPFRLLDYRVRGYRRYPDKTMRQVVIYLSPTESALVYQTSFFLENTSHHFEVVRLWEQPSEVFLQFPGLLPFAVLGQSANPVEALRGAATAIDQLGDPYQRANLMAASAILAGLRLEEEIILQLVRRDIMRESTVYRSILAEGLAEGRARGLDEGRAEGRAEGRVEGALSFLRAGISVEVIAQGTGLTTTEIEQLQQQLDT
jgi:predicted transposase/invertase (TIGR01784 family)